MTNTPPIRRSWIRFAIPDEWGNVLAEDAVKSLRSKVVYDRAIRIQRVIVWCGLVGVLLRSDPGCWPILCEHGKLISKNMPRCVSILLTESSVRGAVDEKLIAPEPLSRAKNPTKRC